MIVKKTEINKFDQDLLKEMIGDSLLSSPLFLKLFEHTGGRPFYLILYIQSEPVALMPIVEYGNGIFKRIQSLTDGLYSKIMIRDNSSISCEECSILFADYLIKEEPAKSFIYDYYNNFNKLTKYDRLDCKTLLVDISSSDWQPPDKKLQSEIRKADKEQVVPVLFNKELHLNKFMKLMEQTEKRHGRKPKYSDKFFKAVAELSQEDDRVEWLWCEYDGKAVASHINFIENDMILNWQVFFDKEFSFLKANQKMLFDSAKRYSALGIKYLNLGASPPEAESLIEYKRKWGAEDYSYSCYIHKSWLGKLW